MQPNNIYRINEKAIHQFSGNAEGFDVAVEQIKGRGVYITMDTPKYELPIIVEQLRKRQSGWICFIDE